jgi:nucleotide-binding universal stress UspA family protein
MPAPFRKILVAVDFSPSSRAALGWALSIAERYRVPVHVLHAWDVPAPLRPDLTVWSGDVRTSLEEHTRLESERSMRQFLDDMKLASRSDVTSEVKQGPAHAVILATADAGGFDLVVMGTHGRTGLSHLVLGSVAEKVVRHARCPVLTVRAPVSAAE